MDVFTEQIVKREKGLWDYINIVFIVFGFLCALIFVFFLSYKFKEIANVFILLLAGMGFLLWRLVTSSNIEYEYCVTNGEIDIDKIIAARKRKRIITFDAKRVETFKKYTGNINNGKFKTTIFAGSHSKSQDLWYCTFKHNEFGNTLLIFEPNEKVLNAIKPFLPRLVANDAFGRN